jgi:HPt (histidine-containing phosphotransfer) domain-containing protein
MKKCDKLKAQGEECTAQESGTSTKQTQEANVEVKAEKENANDSATQEICIEDYVDVNAGREFAMNNEEFYRETIKIYLEEGVEKRGEADKALEKGDMLAYSTLVHMLKSNSRLVGASRLGDLAFDLEMKSKEGDVEYCRAHQEALTDEYVKVVTALEQYLKKG